MLLIGPKILDPRNVAWLGSGDPATHYLGWVSFRYAPWTLPIGLNPDYGLEISTSILFSDSNPLLAFIFKPFSALLGDPFQYFGLWLLTCFILQSWFGWKLAGIATRDPWSRALAGAIFCMSPPMIWRINGHLSLVGHFFVLAALYLSLRPDQLRRTPYWVVLLACAAMVHAYLLAMTCVLWIASWISVFFFAPIDGEGMRRRLVQEMVAVAFVVAFTLWQVGYLTVGPDIAGEGYGVYRANLNTFFDSGGWSRILQDLPDGPGDYEGFNYLGIGGIFLGLFAIPVVIGSRALPLRSLRRLIPLILSLVGLSAFAITNRVGLNNHEFHIDLPVWVLGAASTLRAAGRMLWPVFYALVFAMMFFVLRGYRPRVAGSLLAIVLIAQCVDTRPGWEARRRVLMQKSSSQLIESPLKDAFWASAIHHYRKIKLVEARNVHPNWLIFANLAVLNRRATDAVYLARINQAKLDALQADDERAINSGRLSEDTLYVLDESQIVPALERVGSRDLVARIDGYAVLAPGWNDCVQCERRESNFKLDELRPAMQVGQTASMALGQTGVSYLRGGWMTPNTVGAPSTGKTSVLSIPIRGAWPTRLTLSASAFVIPQHPVQRVTCRVNGGPPALHTLTGPGQLDIAVPPRPSESANNEALVVELTALDAARPSDLKYNTDTRLLSFTVETATLR